MTVLEPPISVVGSNCSTTLATATIFDFLAHRDLGKEDPIS